MVSAVPCTDARTSFARWAPSRAGPERSLAQTLVVTPGNIPDAAGLMQCIGAVAPSCELVADKGYDAAFIREGMEKRGGAAMILTKCNRLIRLPVDAAG